MSGIAYLIGAGPGDPGLLTIKGKECIEAADVIIYDYLADSSLLGYARGDAELIYAGKQAGNHALTQDETNALLVKLVGEGKCVARLKGGDPLVFGRGGEEAMALRECGLDFEIVPGVTSAIAAPAYAGIPVTHRAVATSFAVITGHEDPTKECSGIDWEGLANGADTLTFVMGLGNLPKITAKLIEYGRSKDLPAAVVCWGTKPEQKTVVGTLSTIAAKVKEAGIKPPGLFIVGEVVALRESLKWRENQALFGRRIVVTRAKNQASSLDRLLRLKGAATIAVPSIRTVTTKNDAEKADMINHLNEYDWMIFTSTNTVKYFFEAMVEFGVDARFLPKQIAAIGKKTAAALKKYGIIADLVPKTAVAESLIEAFKEIELTGKKVLIPRAKEARELLPETLQSFGALVSVVPVYETVPETDCNLNLKALIEAGSVDVVTFTSASTVRNMVALLGDADCLKSVSTVVIGTVTAQALMEYDVTPTMVANEASIESLVDAVESVCKGEK